ncbi:N-acetyltransferase [Clostridium tyrobutyricum]|uniref:acyltransferase n=1 Tax=Clostridium tyrobutyricum TaxID=1519 RepID=UPI001C384E6C|nr:acyltransferase [Clostridium tyrobutyricum]MBV4418317.1 N-acetyltransferase [Clostridium tyrobutyricum]
MDKCFISETANIGKNVSFGCFVVVEDEVVIGDNCIISNNVVIHKGAIIGDNVRIDDNAVIGKQPMRAANSIFKDDEEPLQPSKIEDGCLIGAAAIVYAGSCIGKNTLVADIAVVRENVTIGEKTIIGKGATVENYCSIGSNCKIQTNAYITAYSKIEDYVFIAPCVVTSNDNYAARSKERFKHFKGVTVKRGGRIGAGAVILPGKTIDIDGFAAAGSVVTKNIESESIVAGNPAKSLRKVPEDQLLKNQQ